MGKKVLMAMSGGVDSSTAALVLLDQGYELVGATMNLWCSDKDAQDAKAIAQKLGFEHHVLDLREDFERVVIKKFCESYLAGLTPNPCIECNRYLKFGLMMDFARDFDCDYVATGHYARIEQDENGWHLLKGADPKKDQSYVLHHLDQETLPKVLFPLGGLEKAQVRKIAADAGFAIAQKAESQDICFVPDGDYASFIENRHGPYMSGGILNKRGDVIGMHKGLTHYTIGQRKGLNLGGGTGDPLYVISKDAISNTLTVGDASDLLVTHVEAADVSDTAGLGAFENMNVLAKANYRQQPKPAVASYDGSTLFIEYKQPQRACSPGQSLVIYSGDEVLCGGTIVSTSR